MKRVLLTAISVAIGAFTIPVVAGASDDDVRVNGTCSGASSSKIKVKPDDGRIEVEFEVDQNENGVNWAVKFKDNSDLMFRGKATTKAPSGSFSIERKIENQAGTDEIVATGVDKASGERCRAKATL